MRKKGLALLALGTVLLVACSSLPASIAPQAAQGRLNAPAPMPGAPGAGSGVATDASKSGAATQGQPSGGVLGQGFQADKVLILTAQLQLKADDPWSAGDRVQQIALGFGGDVIGVNQSGNDQNRSAMVTIRVPNDQFNAALARIKGLDGVDVLSSQVTGEDKTDQFVDLDARLKAKQDEEQRYLALLNRASTIDDVLKIDGVLSTVRSQIEQLQGQVNLLKERSSMATISVAINSSPILPKPVETGWQPQKTFEAALGSLGAFLRTFADAAIWAAVWAWIPLLGLAAVLIVSRRARMAS